MSISASPNIGRDVAAAPPPSLTRATVGIAAAAMAAALAARLRLDPAAPLWLDESWTGAFAAQPSLAALTGQIRDDANAPAYYYLVWVWARAFGLSNAALHALSLVLSLLAPAVAWAGLRRELPILALTWAVLLATWLPGIDQSDEARCYPLLLSAATLSTVAHLRLLRAPTLRRASAWAACAAFVTLVHYHAGILAFSQGLAFLALHRGRALRLWPAALLFAPAFAWLAWHAPRLAEFARPDVAWYSRLTASDLPSCLLVLVGRPLLLLALTLALLIAAVRRPERKRGARGEAAAVDRAIRWAGWAAVVAAAACIAIGVLRPTFTHRYLTPFVPGTSLLAVAWAVRSGRVPNLTAGVLMGGALAAVAAAVAAQPVAAARVYNFEVASAWLSEARPSRLVFFWDHPADPVEARDQLDAVGGFFLRRAGLRLDVTPLYPTADDMNGPALAAAGSDAAVLWIYDTAIHHTSARLHPPRLAALDPGLECRDFGALNIGVTACRRRPDP